MDSLRDINIRRRQAFVRQDTRLIAEGTQADRLQPRVVYLTTGVSPYRTLIKLIKCRLDRSRTDLKCSPQPFRGRIFYRQQRTIDIEPIAPDIDTCA